MPFFHRFLWKRSYCRIRSVTIYQDAKSTYLIEKSWPKRISFAGQAGVWVGIEIDREESIVLDTADDQTQNRSNDIKNTRKEREREREIRYILWTLDKKKA